MQLSPLRFMLSLAMLAAAPSHAAPAPPAVRAEIELLLSALNATGCEFNRNGSWYTGGDARSHLLKKLEYLEDHNAIKTAENFIELGASTSSFSGKPYLVKCGAGNAVESRGWLQERLKLVRERKS